MASETPPNYFTTNDWSTNQPQSWHIKTVKLRDFCYFSQHKVAFLDSDFQMRQLNKLYNDLCLVDLRYNVPQNELFYQISSHLFCERKKLDEIGDKFQFLVHASYDGSLFFEVFDPSDADFADNFPWLFNALCPYLQELSNDIFHKWYTMYLTTLSQNPQWQVPCKSTQTTGNAQTGCNLGDANRVKVCSTGTQTDESAFDEAANGVQAAATLISRAKRVVSTSNTRAASQATFLSPSASTSAITNTTVQQNKKEHSERKLSLRSQAKRCLDDPSANKEATPDDSSRAIQSGSAKKVSTSLSVSNTIDGNSNSLPSTGRAVSRLQKRLKLALVKPTAEKSVNEKPAVDGKHLQSNMSNISMPSTSKGSAELKDKKESFEDKFNLAIRNSKDPSGGYTCSQCEQKYKKLWRFCEHLLTHEELPYRCKFVFKNGKRCVFGSDYKTKVLEHISSHRLQFPPTHYLEIKRKTVK